MMIQRMLTPVIKKRLRKGKAVILVGARQVGKTTLFNSLAADMGEPYLRLNCDEPEARTLLTSPSISQLRLMIGNNKIVMIDEAQRVPEIGLTLKLIVENFPDVQLLVTGSSALDLNSSIKEPLTGRKYEYTLYPICTAEILESEGLLATNQMFASRLIYGSYPEVITTPEDARQVVTSLADNYLYKDILEMDKVRKPMLLSKLLMAISLQVGSEVSYTELAQTIGSDPKTVERYIDLLEKSYIIFRVGAFSRNLRTELKKSKKIYFYDNGIRNAVIQDFSPLDMRQDVGALWENFVVSERVKYNHYRGYGANTYFWRTTAQQEIDLVEEKDGKLSIFEMKWNPKKSGTRFPATFISNYNVAESKIITPDNYLSFVTTADL